LYDEHGSVDAIHPPPFVKQPDKKLSQSLFYLAVLLSEHYLSLQAPDTVSDAP
jgi:hypothetical protein